MVKQFILNADGLGMSKDINGAVLDAYKSGFLKSISLCPTGSAFEDAVNTVLPQCPDFSVGVHLNVTEGKSYCSGLSKLTNEHMEFKNSYLKLLLMAYNPKEGEFFQQLEREFRRQIETVLSKTKVTHIDSNEHIHSIPPIFNLVCKLASEYKIPYVRTHFEKIYMIPDIYKNMNLKFYKNFLKKLILNFFTVINENTVHKYELKTNDYIIGINYAGLMNSMVIAYGIKAIKNKNTIVETAIYPCRYEDGTIDKHFDEYMITKSKKLEDKIRRSGYDITNYAVNDENPSEQ